MAARRRSVRAEAAEVARDGHSLRRGVINSDEAAKLAERKRPCPGCRSSTSQHPV